MDAIQGFKNNISTRKALLLTNKVSIFKLSMKEFFETEKPLIYAIFQPLNQTNFVFFLLGHPVYEGCTHFSCRVFELIRYCVIFESDLPFVVKLCKDRKDWLIILEKMA